MFILLYILLFFTNPETPCVVGEAEIQKSIQVLYKEKILDKDEKFLYLGYVKPLERYLIGEKLSVENNTVRIKRIKNRDNQWLVFTSIYYSKKFENRIELSFKARYWYEYQGDIVFECINGQIQFTSIHYSSSIE